MTDRPFIALILESLQEVAPTRMQEFQDLSLATRIDDLGLGSVEVIEMITGVEERLRITLPEDELQKIQTFADLARLVQFAGGTVG